ncbi:Eukaryotic translation initiation factor 3 [Mycena venus]|uniref:Eukaryotic translation initiation factor 3 n=1 Tax=Mycena venus TaxID=2733690 RepID=A0A8H6Z894_9AGAR|nr:Eukaryotic translation initiation factor 3 [Mycena venus]
MAGRKPNNLYRPKKPNANLSEEEEDDFVDVVDDAASTSKGSKKRKIIVVDGIAQAPPPKKMKKSNTPPPKVDVIEIDDESDDEVRSGGKRGPKSQTRDHFEPPVAITHNGEKQWSFRTVIFKRTVAKNQLFGDEKPAPALDNFPTHYRQRHEGVPVPPDVQLGEIRGVLSASSAKIMADFLVEGKLNPAINSTQKNFLKVAAAWIIEDDLPFTTGETPGIRRLFAFLQTRYMLPSDTTVRNTLAVMYIDMYNLVMSELAANVKSKIAVATDTWTKHAMTYTFAGTIASWITSDWELVERVLDFHPIEDKEHEGEYAALGLAKRLNDFKALEKISYNLYLIETSLTTLILAALSDVADPDVTDDYLPNKDVPFHYNPDNDPALDELEREVFDDTADTDADEDEAIALTGLASEFKKMIPLQKLRIITTKICSSPQRRKRFRTTAERMFPDKLAPSGRKLASLMVVRDVRHRWNYTHAMIERALLLRKAIDTWVFEKEELQPLSLNDNWKLLEALGDNS